jgi:hypothetical protein
MKTKRSDFKNIYFPVLAYCIILVVLWHAFAASARAAEEPYAIISKKNLFHPERKEWIMEKADAGKGTESKMVPRFDPKLISLTGTVVAGEETRAVITTKSGRQEKGYVYMAGDYVEGYLIKSIVQRQVVLTNTATKEDYTVSLNVRKDKTASQNTEVPREMTPETTRGTSMAVQAEKSKKRAEQGEGVKTSLGEQKNEKKPSVKSGNKPVESKWTSSDTLTNRMQSSIDILKNNENSNVRLQAERDYKTLQNRFSDMTPQERQKVITRKKELDSITSKRK